MDDIELQAMGKANDVVKGLTEEQRVRVIQWLGARYIGSYSPARTIQDDKPVIVDSDTPARLASASKNKAKKARTTTKVKESFSIVKDLDLSEKTSPKSLRNFYSEKVPGSEMEHVAVFVYFLERIAKINAITINHIYTCYKDVSKRVPATLKQIVWNTASQNGWVDATSLDAIKVATAGENFVEFDLPKSKAK